MIPGNNWTGHICVLPFVIRDSYTLSDWNSFWNQLKNKKLQANNYYNCKNQIFHFIVGMFFFFALKDFPGYLIPVQQMQEIAFREFNFRNFLGEHAPWNCPSPCTCTCSTNSTSLLAEPLLSNAMENPALV